MTGDEILIASSAAAMGDHVLEIEYLIRGFRRVLYVPPPQWPGCRFEQGENLDVTLHMTHTGLTLGTNLDTLIAFTDARMRQLVLAWELLLGQRLQLRRGNVAPPRFPLIDGAATSQAGATFSDRCEATIVHAPAPMQMPQVPLAAERWVRTLAEAGDLEGYVEEQLRRHYLIIEELWEDYALRFDDVDKARCEEIRCVRNFVSHSKCTRDPTLGFITTNLPSAEVQQSSPRAVRFDRISQEHRAFVARYAVDSERIARMLVQLKIEDLRSMSG